MINREKNLVELVLRKKSTHLLK